MELMKLRIDYMKPTKMKPAIIPSLSRLLNRNVQVEERYTAEDTHHLHVSSLYAACMRKIHLLWQTGEREYRSIPLATQIKFDTGIAVEAAMRKRLKQIGVIELEQPSFFDAEYGIVAHADGRLKNGKLLEIKSKDPAIFKMTQHYPLRRDQFQVESYLWMDKTIGGTLLSFTWGQATVPINDLNIRYNLKTVEVVKRTVGSLRDAEAGGPIPLRVCASRDEKMAVLCPVRDHCFLMESNGLAQTIEKQLQERQEAA